MKRKILTLAITFLLLIALVGCGNSKKKETIIDEVNCLEYVDVSTSYNISNTSSIVGDMVIGSGVIYVKVDAKDTSKTEFEKMDITVSLAGFWYFDNGSQTKTISMIQDIGGAKWICKEEIEYKSPMINMKPSLRDDLITVKIKSAIGKYKN